MEHNFEIHEMLDDVLGEVRHSSAFNGLILKKYRQGFRCSMLRFAEMCDWSISFQKELESYNRNLDDVSRNFQSKIIRALITLYE